MSSTKKTDRKPRTFTTSEALASHPILHLFDRDELREVMRKHDLKGLRFSELQFLLCEENPVPRMVEECDGDLDCDGCRRRRKCRLTRYARLAEIRRSTQRYYKRKSNLADDLVRLVGERYLRCNRWGLYERGERRGGEAGPFVASANKARVLRSVRRASGGEVSLIDQGRLVMISYDSGEGAPGERAIALTRELEEELLRETVQRKLGEIADWVEGLAAAEVDALWNVRLREIVLGHLDTRLALWGYDSLEFPAVVGRISRLDLGLTEEEAMAISTELEEERSVLDEWRGLIAKLQWLIPSSESHGERLIKFVTSPRFEVDLDDQEGEVIDAGIIRSAFSANGVVLEPDASISQPYHDHWLVTSGQHACLVIINASRMKVLEWTGKAEPRFDHVLKASRILDRQQRFDRWFSSGPLCLRMDVEEEAPVLIIGATSGGKASPPRRSRRMGRGKRAEDLKNNGKPEAGQDDQAWAYDNG